MKRIVAICLFLAVFTGCASGPPRAQYNDAEQRYRSYAGDPINRFISMAGISGWESVSDKQLVLRTGINKAYLVTVWTCPELTHAHSIQVVSSLSNIVSRSDKVIVDGKSCPIREIRQIDVMRMKADKAARKAQKRS